jgi:hypothetical protein
VEDRSRGGIKGTLDPRSPYAAGATDDAVSGLGLPVIISHIFADALVILYLLENDVKPGLIVLSLRDHRDTVMRRSNCDYCRRLRLLRRCGLREDRQVERGGESRLRSISLTSEGFPLTPFQTDVFTRRLDRLSERGRVFKRGREAPPLTITPDIDASRMNFRRERVGSNSQLAIDNWHEKC